MEAGRLLGVETVVTAKEMSDPDVDHLGIMAYVARFRAAAATSRFKPAPRDSLARPSRVNPTSSAAAPQTPPLMTSSFDNLQQLSPVTNYHHRASSASPLVQRVRIQPPTTPGYVNQMVITFYKIFLSLSSKLSLKCRPKQ